MCPTHAQPIRAMSYPLTLLRQLTHRFLYYSRRLLVNGS